MAACQDHNTRSTSYKTGLRHPPILNSAQPKLTLCSRTAIQTSASAKRSDPVWTVLGGDRIQTWLYLGPMRSGLTWEYINNCGRTTIGRMSICCLCIHRIYATGWQRGSEPEK
ncbi:hypothetical protein OPQ81_006236 [Rhizoctonia solani]|nr:hypothetical protein OPQ81_006236 [Rhizoctonia solani]